jgi:hypothetical protein
LTQSAPVAPVWISRWRVEQSARVGVARAAVAEPSEPKASQETRGASLQTLHGSVVGQEARAWVDRALAHSGRADALRPRIAYRSTRALAPATSRSTSTNVAIEVSPGVVIARVPCAGRACRDGPKADSWAASARKEVLGRGRQGAAHGSRSGRNRGRSWLPVPPRPRQLLQPCGPTSFVIAHRLYTIRNANTIVLMGGGHIVEQGNHAELLARAASTAPLRETVHGSSGDRRLSSRDGGRPRMVPVA